MAKSPRRSQTEKEVDALLNNEPETAPRRERRERPVGEVLVSGANYHDFDREPVLIGSYLRTVKREKDGNNADQKAGDVIGFEFVNSETGEQVIVTAAHAVKKALEAINYDTKQTLWIEFEGKAQLKNGKPYNRFHIVKYKP